MRCSTSQIKPKLIGVETLNKFFEKNNLELHHSTQGFCAHCEKNVEVIITKTSGGYGIQGGALYEKNSEIVCMLCPKCYEKL